MSTQTAGFSSTLLLAVAIEPAEIGRRLKQAREKKGWTQLQFAYEANVSPSSVQRWEAGRLPPVRELMRLADVLGVSSDVLVEQPEDEASLAEIHRQLADEVARLGELNDRLEERLARPAAPRRART